MTPSVTQNGSSSKDKLDSITDEKPGGKAAHGGLHNVIRLLASATFLTAQLVGLKLRLAAHHARMALFPAVPVRRRCTQARGRCWNVPACFCFVKERKALSPGVVGQNYNPNQ